MSYVVRKKADAYQPISFKALKWSEIFGIAVATIVWSKATSSNQDVEQMKIGGIYEKYCQRKTEPNGNFS